MSARGTMSDKIEEGGTDFYLMPSPLLDIDTSH